VTRSTTAAVLLGIACLPAVAYESFGQAHLSRAAATRDLDSLGAIVRTRAAYRLLNGYPFQAHLDSLARQLPESIHVRDFWRQVQTAVGRLQDAHSNVRLPQGVSPYVATGELPFLLTTAGDTVVALASCGCALLVHDFPRVRAINGVPLDSLMRIAGVRFAGHSPQRYRYRALAALTPIEGVLQLAGAARGGALEVQLAGSRGDTTIRVRTVARRTPALASPDAQWETSGAIGVLTVRVMSERADTIVRGVMARPDFEASRALVIDVRGNDGGTRHVLETIVSALIDAPLVYNVAVARGDTNELGDRALVLPDDRSLSPRARAALTRALASFQPKWDYTVDTFLPQRFGAVLEPSTARRLTGRPVVVLLDERCFSATDVFLGALRRIPHVTLMGTASSGGSGRSREYGLPASRLTVVLSTMASFQPDGSLYDGVGIAPTITVERSIRDLASGRDTQKTAALAHLRRLLEAR
jgi:hypothetical protein